MDRKPYPPGQHGGRRKKPSEYALQLKEKQKIRHNYGISERQLKRFVHEALRLKGEPGKNLLSMLESRLDNVVFRAGLAPSIPAARQLVAHNHILIDGKRVNIPSFIVKTGQKLSISTKATKIPSLITASENPPLQRPSWITYDENSKETAISAAPNEEFVPFPIEISKVIEYYSRRVS